MIPRPRLTPQPAIPDVALTKAASSSTWAQRADAIILAREAIKVTWRDQPVPVDDCDVNNLPKPLPMKKCYWAYLAALVFALNSCTGDTQIGKNTFVHQNKIYKIIDNELREIGDLSAKDIKRFEVSKPKQKDLGSSTLNFVKPGATTTLKALYRGNYLYYSLTLDGLDDLRDNYRPGTLTIEFIDEYGFIMHSTELPTGELIGLLGSYGKYSGFVYHGKTEMSTEINTAIRSYDVTASIRKKSIYGY